MITEEKLTEWELDPSYPCVVPTLIAEVRRLRVRVTQLIRERDWLRAERDEALREKWQAEEALALRRTQIVDGEALANVRRERDALRKALASVRNGLDKIADGACDPPMTSYGTGCSGQCKYVAEAALAKLDEVTP